MDPLLDFSLWQCKINALKLKYPQDSSNSRFSSYTAKNIERNNKKGSPNTFQSVLLRVWVGSAVCYPISFKPHTHMLPVSKS